MNDNKFDFNEDLKGSMWPDSAEILRKGSINLNGKKTYCAIVKSKNNKGQSKYELMVSCGLLFANDETQKARYPKSPDIGGKVTIENEIYKFGGWKNELQDGREYTSVSLKPVEDEPQQKSHWGNSDTSLDDDVPF